MKQIFLYVTITQYESRLLQDSPITLERKEVKGLLTTKVARLTTK